MDPNSRIFLQIVALGALALFAAIVILPALAGA